MALAPAVWLLWTLGPPVQAPEPSAPLTWEAPPSCPSAESVAASIEQFAPGVLEQVDPDRARLRAVVEIDGTGYAATVTTTSPEARTSRVLQAADCRVIAEAVALMTAVALDPLRSAETIAARTQPPPSERAPSEPAAPNQPEPEFDPKPEPEPEPERDPPPEPVPTARVNLSDPAFEAPRNDRLRAPRFAARVFAGGGYGPTDTGYATIGGAVALYGDRWRAQVGAGWSTPRTIRSAADASVGGTFDAWHLAARGCFVPTVGARQRLELPLCPGVELGQVRGRGLDELPVALDAEFLWFALGVGQGLWFVPTPRVAVGVDLQLALPTTRGRFLVDSTAVQRIEPVTIRALAGVEVRLP